jgi:NADH-quinone oxidoreductase subunit L
MVAAGVFLVARAWPLFSLSTDALPVTLAIGGVTAVGAAAAALAQTDIKKVLAYSTISQLGFMFAALGAAHGAPRSSTSSRTPYSRRCSSSAPAA